MPATRFGIHVRALLLVCILLTVGSCQNGGSSGGGQARPGVLVTFVRSGGFAGVRDHLEVGDAGKGRVTTKRQPAGVDVALDPAQMADLSSVLSRAKFGSLQVAYGTPGAIADNFQYEVSHEGTTVTVHDLSAAPPTLQAAIGQLEFVVAQASG